MTSAAIPRVTVARPRASLARALGACAFAAILAGLAFAGHALADLDAQARCSAERDASGLGRHAALRALDEPSTNGRFVYRVRTDSSGYRASVTVRAGAFAGDEWERDADGRVRHRSDMCRDGTWRARERT